ncbi:AMP-binding protein [Pseudonocardia oroxyli]|uniref:AMP-binding enzyme C-terminal domain-containing protein n=1 Tax=Pseudonocardia oroxyli TaxID=366584 RepID=A0A1G7NKT7_PSEOR|nr:AMP-binding protein [Pseudonocardia oroxyli]SDF74633.1 AMP-binding enzyme C-terminal domain-containing protein [Pseudonocardia oroxyli]
MLIGDVLSFTAARRADEPALVFEDRTWTYAELDREVRRLADGLTRHAEPGDRIAILTENNAEYVQAYYGVPAAGMALVFLNYRLSPREVALNLEDCAPTVLITERKYLETARRASADVPSIRTLVCLDGPADGALTWADLLGDDVDPPRVDETLPAWLIYTSGTTGRAKGAVLTHRNVVAAVLNSLISWEHDHDPGVSLMPRPLCHIAGYGVAMAHLRGDQVCAGYWNRPEATAEAVRGGWFHQVEEVLFQHPDVAAAAVVGQPDEVWGQLVVAVVEAREGHTVTEEGVREFCRGVLAGYKIPRRVLVVPELPRTTSGKVRKPELRALVAETAEMAETPEIAARRG